MIARIWAGTTRDEDADACEEYLKSSRHSVTG